MKNTEKTMDKIVALCKNRGFIFAGSEIYGGLANTWDYGPLGVELKNNIKNCLLYTSFAEKTLFFQKSGFTRRNECGILIKYARYAYRLPLP